MTVDDVTDACEVAPASGGGQPRSVFLSYARKDGQAFAELVRARLTGLGYDVWQDVVDMAGGRDWWLQIEERIQRASAVVSVTTGGALASPVVRREWTHARRVGTPFLPVTNDPLVFAAAPRWLGKLDVFVLAPDHPRADATWARLVHQLAYPPAPRPVPFVAPGFPAELVARDGPRRSMVDALLDERGEDPRFGTVVVHGPPGFGKTTLAQEVCHDPRVLDAFTGGVLWATLGEQGQGVLPGLTAAVSALTGALAAFNSLEEAAARLAELLESRDCLLVLDDVWDRAHLQPFLGSEHVARLVTTRSLEWLGAEGNTRVIALDQMDRAEAAQVLLNHVPPGALREADPAALRPALGELAGRLGEWPLLLGIFGGALRSEIVSRGRSVRDALAWLRDGLDATGLTAFDLRRSEDRNQALAGSVDVSLRPFTEAERMRLFELTVFPPGVRVPEPVAARLWSATGAVSGFEAGRLLREFGGTFFRLDAAPGAGPSELRLRFHDALREHLASRLPAGHAEEVHRLLVASYLPGGLSPWTVPDDGYLYDHLTYHLQAGAEDDALHELMRDRAWFEARLAQRHHKYDGVIVDVERAADSAAVQARRQIDAGDPPRPVIHLARYRLMLSTIDGLADRSIPEVVVRAVELGVWSPEQAVSVARRIPEPGPRIAMLRQLLARAVPLGDQRDEAERLAVAAVEEWHQAPAHPLVELSDQLSGARRETVLARALRAATEYPKARGEANRLAEALGRYSNFSVPAETAHALAAVARRLQGDQRSAAIREGVAIARDIADDKERAYALAAWLDLLDSEDYRSGYRDARACLDRIENQQERLSAAAAVAAAATGPDRQQLLDAVWEEAWAIEDEPWRAFCLARAAPLLDEERRRACLALALGGLRSPGAQQNLTIERFKSLLTRLAPSWSAQEAADVSVAADYIVDSKRRTELKLALGLPLDDEVLGDLLQDVIGTGYRYGWRAGRNAQLAARLSRPLVEQALSGAGGRLPGDEKSALAALEHWGDGRQADDPPNAAGVAASAASTGLMAQQRQGPSWLLWGQVPRPDNDPATDLLQELDRVADPAGDAWRSDQDRIFALLSVIAQLPPRELPRVWPVANSIADNYDRSLPLVALALRTEGADRRRALAAGIEALLAPGDAKGDWHANIIEQMVPLLSSENVSRLLEGIVGFDEWGRIRALKAVFPHVEHEHLPAALAAVNDLTNDSSKSELLQLLPGPFDEDDAAAVVEAIERLADERQRVDALVAITSAAAEQPGRLIDAATRLSPGDRATVLSRLLRTDPQPGRLMPLIRQGIVEHLHRSPQVPRAAVLAFLADPHLLGEPVLDGDTAGQVARTCVEVCRDWPWR